MKTLTNLRENVLVEAPRTQDFTSLAKVSRVKLHGCDI